MKYLLILSVLFMIGCDKKDVVTVTYPKYALVPCNYATTSKAGTVLEIKTVCRIEQDTGVTVYANEGVWYRFQ